MGFWLTLAFIIAVVVFFSVDGGSKYRGNDNDCGTYPGSPLC